MFPDHLVGPRVGIYFAFEVNIVAFFNVIRIQIWAQWQVQYRHICNTNTKHFSIPIVAIKRGWNFTLNEFGIRTNNSFSRFETLCNRGRILYWRFTDIWYCRGRFAFQMFSFLYNIFFRFSSQEFLIFFVNKWFYFAPVEIKIAEKRDY